MPASVFPAKNNFIVPGSAHHAAIEAYVALLKLKNYSDSTITTYRHWFTIFLCHFPDHKPSTITKYEVMDFLSAYGTQRSGVRQFRINLSMPLNYFLNSC
ncbi:MAG: phage integrase N-terminal SAM-like domain-containing protein [Bacteroidota bacterium]|nr:phage integrase N-terminal SAM-like domain-containing protein [Bacteroidota bacterium]